jgi:hypothetical protein
VARVGRLLGLPGAEHGYETARGADGAIDLPRAY